MPPHPFAATIPGVKQPDYRVISGETSIYGARTDSLLRQLRELYQTFA
jgi:hypothetical protein